MCLAFPAEDIKLVTQPKPGQEFVFVQSSESGATPIARKENEEDHVRIWKRKTELIHYKSINFCFIIKIGFIIVFSIKNLKLLIKYLQT